MCFMQLSSRYLLTLAQPVINVVVAYNCLKFGGWVNKVSKAPQVGGAPEHLTGGTLLADATPARIIPQ